MKSLKRTVSAVIALILMIAVIPAGASPDRFSVSEGLFAYDLPGDWELNSSRDSYIELRSKPGGNYFMSAVYDETALGEPDHESTVQYVRNFYAARYETEEKELKGQPVFLFRGIVERNAWKLTGCVSFIDGSVVILYYYEPNTEFAEGEGKLLEYLSTLQYDGQLVFGEETQV